MSEPRTETPQDAARRLAGGRRVEALHVYRDAAGEVIYHRIRARDRDGAKWIRPMRLNGHGYELGEPDFPNGKPLYKLDRIAANPDAAVWIVEGEKAAGALTKLGAVATTSGGAQSAAAADWTPLRGRECIAWADNDDAGVEYMDAVAAILQGLDGKLSTVDVDALALPPKGDAWDWAHAHPQATLADLEALRRSPARTAAADVSAPSALAPSATAADSSGTVVEVARADTIAPEAVEWLWGGYIALGMPHLIAGAPGTGKTTLALAFAATISSGGRWPDGTRAIAGDVLIWSGEDSAANTLVPRLIAMRADMSRVHIVRGVSADGERRWFDPAKDFPALTLAAARLPRLRLMIVDPIVSAVPGDSHKNSETRRGLQPLVEFAERVGCALYGVTHFSKASSARDPIERVTGSIAFAAVPRIIMATAKLPEDQGGGRVLVRCKSNIGPDGGGFRYELRQGELDGAHRGIVASRVEWGAPIEGTAREILATAETDTDPSERNERTEAADWLKATLAEAGGEMLKAEVIRAAERAGYKERTMHRARIVAGVRAVVSGFGAGKRSVWRLDGSASVPPIMPIMPPQNVGTNGTNGGMDAPLDGEAGSAGNTIPADLERF